jgi:hypothetical protein
MQSRPQQNVGDDETVQARSIVMASGARYRRFDVARLEGSSVHYWALPIEARLCGGEKVALVAAGSSAGQAAVYVRKQAWLARARRKFGGQHVALICVNATRNFPNYGEVKFPRLAGWVVSRWVDRGLHFSAATPDA